MSREMIMSQGQLPPGVPPDQLLTAVELAKLLGIGARSER